MFQLAIKSILISHTLAIKLKIKLHQEQTQLLLKQAILIVEMELKQQV